MALGVEYTEGGGGLFGKAAAPFLGMFGRILSLTAKASYD
jgi:hypothetical protein